MRCVPSCSPPSSSPPCRRTAGAAVVMPADPAEYAGRAAIGLVTENGTPHSGCAARRARAPDVGLDPDRRAGDGGGRRGRAATGRSRRPGRGAAHPRPADRAKRPLAPAADDRARSAADRPGRSSARSSRCARSSSRSPRTCGSAPCSRSPRESPCSCSRSGSPARAILAAYLVSMGLDAETVALSPFGPSQSGRFYGINNLLETMLLAPSLVGAALLGRWGIGVAALAFVTIGGNRFGADGGGMVVLAAAYLVLLLRLRGQPADAAPRRERSRPGRSRSRCSCSGSTRRPVARATSPTLSATGRSRSRGDIADRIERSVRRTAASLGATAVVLGSLAILVAIALRARRGARARRVPRRPGGLAPRQRHAQRRARDGRRDRDRTCPLPAPARPVKLALDAPCRHLRSCCWPCLVGVAGCGGGEEVAPLPETVEGTVPAETTDETTTGETTDHVARGRCGERREAVFASAGCGGCHTLEAAGSTRQRRPESRRREARLRARRRPRHERSRARCRRSRASSASRKSPTSLSTSSSRPAEPPTRLSRVTSPRSRATSTAP